MCIDFFSCSKELEDRRPETEARRRKGKSEIRILKAEMPKQQVDGNQQILYRI